MKLVDLIAENLVKYETLTKEQIDYLVENGKMKDEEVKKEKKDDNTLDELKSLAKEKGIKGYTKMSKDELKKELEK